MLIKQLNRFSENGIFAEMPIPGGTVLFTYDDWSEEEQHGWDMLNTEEVLNLSPEDFSKYMQYGYDIEFGKMIGTFDWANARHMANFLNHSCDPNIMYNANDEIMAKRDIMAGEEITIDYANFTVNLDCHFRCLCGSSNCRYLIRKDDWRLLVPNYQFNFPTFMHGEIRKILGASYA